MKDSDINKANSKVRTDWGVRRVEGKGWHKGVTRETEDKVENWCTIIGMFLAETEVFLKWNLVVSHAGGIHLPVGCSYSRDCWRERVSRFFDAVNLSHGQRRKMSKNGLEVNASQS